MIKKKNFKNLNQYISDAASTVVESFHKQWSPAKGFNCLMIYLTLLLALTGCKKLVEVDGPVTSTNSANVYTTDATAAAVLTGIYTTMTNTYLPNGGITAASLFLGLSSDELQLFSGSTNPMYIGYYTNALTNSNTSTSDFWKSIYPIIFSANSAIEGLTKSTSLTPTVKTQLLGEAKFVRAFCYFYLVNLYGDVPLVVSTDYIINTLLPRTAITEVYQQIITDLKDAQTLLSSNYLDAALLTTSVERVRPNKWAATAMLARVYLYTGNWANAELQASAIIDNTASYKLINELKDVFLANSTEAIWQLQPVGVNIQSNTPEGRLFVLPLTGPSANYPVYLSNNLVSNFEPGDMRKTNWVNNLIVGSNTFYYPYKYKIGAVNTTTSEYSMVLRLAEQYLIRAEARTQQNNIGGAQDDLNKIRTRAGLSMTTAADKTSLLSSILQERQVELFSEWGHRWLDLKRTNTVDAVMNIMTPKKGGNWNTKSQWYPISAIELQRSPNLVQNPGY